MNAQTFRMAFEGVSRAQAGPYVRELRDLQNKIREEIAFETLCGRKLKSRFFP